MWTYVCSGYVILIGNGYAQQRGGWYAATGPSTDVFEWFLSFTKYCGLKIFFLNLTNTLYFLLQSPHRSAPPHMHDPHQMLFLIQICKTLNNQRTTLRFPILKRCFLKSLRHKSDRSFMAMAWVTGWISSSFVVTVLNWAGCSLCLGASRLAKFLWWNLCGWNLPVSGTNLAGTPREWEYINRNGLPTWF